MVKELERNNYKIFLKGNYFRFSQENEVKEFAKIENCIELREIGNKCMPRLWERGGVPSRQLIFHFVVSTAKMMKAFCKKGKGREYLQFLLT